MTAEEAFFAITPKMGRPSEESKAATSFIQEMMQAGKLPATECETKLIEAGFKKSTIKKAKRNAGVSSVKEGMIWYWVLPIIGVNSDGFQTVSADDDLPFDR